MGSAIIINHQRRILILLWVTLLVIVRGNDANQEQTKEIKAEVGSSAVIPCDLSDKPDIKMKSAVWYKCKQNCIDSDIILSFNNSNSKNGFDLHGRVSLLEPDLQLKNYSINIKNLTKSDSGFYQLRVMNETFCKANITVTDGKKHGETAANSSETLNPNCTVNSSLPHVLTWTQHGSNLTLISSAGTATLVISPGEFNPSGLYICTVTHPTNTPQKETNVTAPTLLEVWLEILTQLEVIIAFVSGFLLSTCFCCTCCLVRKCHRKKQKTHGDMDVTLEMVTSQEDPLMDVGQAEENNLDIDQEALRGEEGPAEGKPDAEYSDLDFSRIKRKNLEEAETAQDTTETEYAEIKKGVAGEEQEEGEIEEEEVRGEAEEINCEEGEEAAEPSNMEAITVQSGDDVS